MKTALEIALTQNPEMVPGKIIRYGCPDRYGIAPAPGWCADRATIGKTCRDCWNQAAGEWEG